MKYILVLIISTLSFVSCQKNTDTKHCQSYLWLDEFQTSGTITINGLDFPYSLSKFVYNGAINFIDLSTCNESEGHHSFVMNNLKTNDTTLLSALALTGYPSVLFAHNPVSVYEPSCIMVGHETEGGYAYLEMIDSNNFNLKVMANLRFRDSTKCEFQQQLLDSMHVQMNLSFKHN